MKILFNTTKKEAVSTLLNLESLKKINDVLGVELHVFKNDYQNYDVVLMMGYDFDVELVKKINPNALIGVIDPRSSFKKQPVGVDFILANGFEMEDYYYSYTNNIYKYYIYPLLRLEKKFHEKIEKVVIAYHGNKVHIEEANPRIIDAIELLGREFDVELMVIYNIKNLGKLSWEPVNFKINYVQWTDDVYETHLKRADIGIVSNFIPIKNELKAKKKISSFFKKYNEHETDYLLRFKVTSNPGRIFPFMQYGIPVVADFFPSASQLINDGWDGYIAYGTNSWYHKMRNLINNSDLRNEIGGRSYDKFVNNYSIDLLNKGLVDFLKNMLNIKKNK